VSGRRCVPIGLRSDRWASARPTRTPSAPSSARYSFWTRSAVRVGSSGEVSAFVAVFAAAADQQVGAVHGLAAARAGDKVLPGPLGERSVGMGCELLPLAHGLAARARRR
jgi:hypothetical protein